MYQTEVLPRWGVFPSPPNQTDSWDQSWIDKGVCNCFKPHVFWSFSVFRLIIFFLCTHMCMGEIISYVDGNCHPSRSESVSSSHWLWGGKLKTHFAKQSKAEQSRAEKWWSAAAFSAWTVWHTARSIVSVQQGSGQAPPRECSLYHFRALKGSRPVLLLPAQRKWRRREVYPAPPKKKAWVWRMHYLFRAGSTGSWKSTT